MTIGLILTQRHSILRSSQNSSVTTKFFIKNRDRTIFKYNFKLISVTVFAHMYDKIYNLSSWLWQTKDIKQKFKEITQLSNLVEEKYIKKVYIGPVLHRIFTWIMFFRAREPAESRLGHTWNEISGTLLLSYS